MDRGHVRARKLLHILYATSFLFFVHFALTAYINSSFLETFIPENTVGLIYAIGSLIGLIGLINISQILNRVGNYYTISALITVTFLALTGLAFVSNSTLAIVIFLIYFAANTLTMYCLDVFVESYSSDATTGSTRGLLLTSQNIGWVLAPMSAGLLVSVFFYQGVYFIALFFILAIFLLLRGYFRDFRDPQYTRLPLLDTARAIFRNRNIRNIYGVSFIFQFFGAFMVIYTPIYLHEYIGFDWQSIGIIFGIMLTAYIFFELPEGRLADRRYGEKEILLIGTGIAALAVASITFITTTAILPWIIIMFITRIGASTMEIMSESYFFKQIKASDAKIISFFRTAAPLAYIVAPISATILLIFFRFEFLFLFLAAVISIGILCIIPLQDTR